MRRVPCTPLHTASPCSPRCFCARRLVDISEMRAEDRRQPLEAGSILEFLVHGEFAYKDSDVNGTYHGAAKRGKKLRSASKGMADSGPNGRTGAALARLRGG